MTTYKFNLGLCGQTNEISNGHSKWNYFTDSVSEIVIMKNWKEAATNTAYVDV